MVGPNGTGKSTILCAICLGLGGQPPLLGRADDARLFIKHEKEQAVVEIELAPNEGQAVHVIRRVIDRDRGSENGKGAGASTYFINGHKSNLKSVKELVKESYHIHIDNLCTFLPQDKVGNFSGFDKQALLLETEKALSGPLYNTHQDLISLEKDLQSSGTDVASIENELSKLKKENERLEREKELMEEREQYLEKIDLLKKKRAWLIFDKKREEAKAAKEHREELKKQKKEAEKAVRPLAEKHAAVEGEHSRIQSQYKALESKVRKDKQAADKALQKVDKYNDDIEGEYSAYNSLDAQIRQARKNVENQLKRLNEIKAEAGDFPPVEEVAKIIKEKQRDMAQVKQKINVEKKRQAVVNDRMEQAEVDKNSSSARLDKLKDDKKLRLQNFCGKFKNVGQAYQFIDQNRKMFRRPIWGPVGKSRSQGVCTLSIVFASLTYLSIVIL